MEQLLFLEPKCESFQLVESQYVNSPYIFNIKYISCLVMRLKQMIIIIYNNLLLTYIAQISTFLFSTAHNNLTAIDQFILTKKLQKPQNTASP